MDNNSCPFFYMLELKGMKNTIKELRNFLLLWSTQALSQLGSSMTSFALSIWIYEKTGSALQSAGLLVSNYAPYVLVSIFAGALSDKWNKKKTMLVCDLIAAFGTVITFVLICENLLMPWHMYIINAVNGLMNTFQQPASEVAMSIITPKKYYHKTSGMKSFSRSLVTILNPLLATAIYSFFGIKVVCVIDLVTFAIAFLVLLFLIQIQETKTESKSEDTITLIKEGGKYLQTNRLILNIILFLSGINFVASAFDTVIVPLVLSKTGGNETILGIVTSFSGIAMLAASLLITFIPESKNKAKTIYVSLLISMLFENFLIALSDSPVIWCIGQIVGWFPIPFFTASYDVLFNTTIPEDMRGRVYSYRNSLQFFLIPVGNLFGGFMVDNIFEPLMSRQEPTSVLCRMFGVGKGSGAALSMFVLGILGVLVCLVFKNKILGSNSENKVQ